VVKEELYLSYISKAISVTGTNTSVTANKLVNSGATFITGATPITIGDLVFNTDTHLKAFVTAVDSDTQLTLSVDIFLASPEDYRINKKVTERVELLGSLEPNLTFNISDIKNPDKRKSDFSKSISLPSSKRINKIFEHIFEINLDLQTFNPNLKTDVLYLVNGETIIDGYLQLKEIKNIDKNITYEVTIIGRVGSFIQDLGDSYLDDLDWTGLNHTYNEATQIASWGYTDYTYPLIDYGFNNGFEDFYVEGMYPAIFAKEYIDRIFDAIGYTYTSTFLTTTPFTKLIIPYNKKEFRLSSTEVATRLFEANTPVFLTPGTTEIALINQTNLSSSMPYQTDTIRHTNEVNDPSNVHNTTTGVYTVNDDGRYDIQVSVQLNAEFKPTGASAATTATSCIMANLNLKNGSTVIDSQQVAITFSGTISGGGTGTTTAVPVYGDGNYKTSASRAIHYLSLNAQNRYAATPNLYTLTASNELLSSGDLITVEFEGVFGSTNASGAGVGKPFYDGANYYDGTADIQLITSTFSNRVVNNAYVEGNTIEMVNAIPHTKQRDFFMSLVKMFNLYVQADTQNDKHLLIEPRDDFLTSDIVDWSQKLDNSKDVSYLPMGALDSKDYLYKYKPDKDYYNELYEATWDKVYGQEKYEITNDFLKKEFKTELIFSPTCCVGQNYNRKVLPTIKLYDETLAAGNNEARLISNIRILYFGGLKSGIWTHHHAGGTTVNSTYPFSGHYDDPFNPTLDLNFGLTKEIYWDNTFSPITLTDNNVFNKYHKKFIEEITDVNSKVVRGYFNLNPSDIKSLSFRKQFRFNNAYFRLNKIENYNPGELTLCEFLKIKDAEVFVPTDTLINGGINGDVPIFTTNIATNNNSLSNQNVTVQGNGNYVNRSSSNIQINGSNNRVFADCSNIQISGSNNVINSGVENVVLINTNNVEITSSNISYYDNQAIGQDSLVEVSTSPYTASEEILTYLVDTNAGNVEFYLPNTTTIGQTFVVKLIEASNTLNITTASGTPRIDGAANKSTSTLYDSFIIRFDGVNYQIISKN
jgi:hypothetical protein